MENETQIFSQKHPTLTQHFKYQNTLKNNENYS